MCHFRFFFEALNLSSRALKKVNPAKVVSSPIFKRRTVINIIGKLSLQICPQGIHANCSIVVGLACGL